MITELLFLLLQILYASLFQITLLPTTWLVFITIYYTASIVNYEAESFLCDHLIHWYTPSTKPEFSAQI